VYGKGSDEVLVAWYIKLIVIPLRNKTEMQISGIRKYLKYSPGLFFFLGRR